MKQLILTISFFVLIALCHAQDIIVTSDAQKIEAKILEVSESNVKYKEIDNLEGPTFVLSTQKIISIIYANGKVSLFHESSTIENNNQVTETYPNFLTRLGENYTYQGRVMNRNVYANFLSNNCPSAYEIYHKGHIIAYSGMLLLSAAIGMEIGTLIGGAITRNFSSSMPWIYCALGCTIASIPLFIVGYNKMHKSVDIFNEQCIQSANRTQSYWSIGASGNGVGLVLNF